MFFKISLTTTNKKNKNSQSGPRLAATHDLTYLYVLVRKKLF